MKRIQGIYSAPKQHWVGDGFPVRSLFSHQSHGKQLSPFLLLDYAGPASFPPAEQPRGVGTHPHRGFETVTIVYEGEVAHRDSTGQGGVIGPGDVQWMTAGAGILHDEYHSPEFTRRGGQLEMVQLWVNLPARYKMTAPTYQAITNTSIPQIELPGGAGSLRVISGKYADQVGPARTFTPMHVWDLRLKQDSTTPLTLPAGWNTVLVILRGRVVVNGETGACEAQVLVFDTVGQHITIEASQDATVLLLAGEPIDEPIAAVGPFVMNSQQEIVQAVEDFKSGRFGHITH